jgi:hypothetical protein
VVVFLPRFRAPALGDGHDGFGMPPRRRDAFGIDAVVAVAREDAAREHASHQRDDDVVRLRGVLAEHLVREKTELGVAAGAVRVVAGADLHALYYQICGKRYQIHPKMGLPRIMTTTIRRIRKLAALLGVIVASSASAARQSAVITRTIVVAAPYNFKYKGSDVVILREPGKNARDVIILDRNSMNVLLLSHAVLVLETFRQKEPVASRRMLIRVPPPNRTNRFQDRAAVWMKMLLMSKPAEVPEVGRGLNITLTPP